MATQLSSICVGDAGTMYEIFSTDAVNSVVIQNNGPAPVIICTSDEDENPALGSLAVTGTQNGAVLLVNHQTPAISLDGLESTAYLYASCNTGNRTTLALYVS
jgi:hypothetical protein